MDKKQFDKVSKYLRDDITAVLSGDHPANYTVALLVCCGCEVLAAYGGKSPSEVFAELLPSGDWRKSARVLFEAIQDGLVRGFDTKFVVIEADPIEIYVSWHEENVITWRQHGNERRLYLGVRPLAERLCTKLEETTTMQ